MESHTKSLANITKIGPLHVLEEEISQECRFPIELSKTWMSRGMKIWIVVELVVFYKATLLLFGLKGPAAQL